MGLLDILSDIFTADNNEIKYRKKIKKNFYNQLKKQLLMTDDEAASVIEIIEEYELKLDKINKLYKTGYNSDARIKQINRDLIYLRDNLKKDVEGIIKFIMRSKVNKVKTLYGGGR